MRYIYISVDAVDNERPEDFFSYRGNPLITPVGNLIIIDRADPRNHQTDNGLSLWRSNLAGVNYAVHHGVLALTNGGGFMMDPNHRTVAYTTLKQLSKILKESYGDDCEVIFDSVVYPKQQAILRRVGAFSETREVIFQSRGQPVSFKRWNGTWLVYNRDSEKWHIPVLKFEADQHFHAVVQHLDVTDTFLERVHVGIEGDQIVNFTGSAGDQLEEVKLNDNNKIFDFLYPGEQVTVD